MMKLTLKPVPKWPKLAWLARSAGGADRVEVLHGACVETADEWCVEAAWAGDFQSGDFDGKPISHLEVSLHVSCLSNGCSLVI